MKRMVLRDMHTSYDSRKTNYKVDDFAFSKLRERYKMMGNIQAVLSL